MAPNPKPSRDRGRKKLALKEVLILGLATAGFVGTAQITPTNLPHQEAPFLHIAGELHSKRVIGLADFAHQNAFPFHTVTEVLSNWLDLASTNGGRLTLALEADAFTADVLRRYLQSGDLEPVLDFWLPFGSLDQLEFYGHLRRFHLRVREVNQSLAPTDGVFFQVLGLEPRSPLSTTNVGVSDFPEVWQASAIANERDRQAAANLLTHLREHPEEHVLVFYGDMHLGIRQTKRSWATRIFGGAEIWNPMGYLLKEQLGDDFLSVAQVQYPPSARQADNPYRALTALDTFITSSEIPWKHPRIDATDYDAAVFFSASTIDEAHLLKYICSRRILDKAIGRLAFFERLPKTAFTAKHPLFSATPEALRLTTGESFQNASEWKAWAATNVYDGLRWIDSADLSEAIRKECGQPGKGPMLASLGLPFPIAFRNRSVTPEQWEEVWPKVQPTVRFLQCLGIYWVGYPDEKPKAREYLVEFSGKEFESADLYLQWFRRNRMGLHY